MAAKQAKTKRAVIKNAWALVNPETGDILDKGQINTARVYANRRLARIGKTALPGSVVRRVTVTITAAD